MTIKYHRRSLQWIQRNLNGTQRQNGKSRKSSESRDSTTEPLNTGFSGKDGRLRRPLGSPWRILPVAMRRFKSSRKKAMQKDRSASAARMNDRTRTEESESKECCTERNLYWKSINYKTLFSFYYFIIYREAWHRSYQQWHHGRKTQKYRTIKLGTKLISSIKMKN